MEKCQKIDLTIIFFNSVQQLTNAEVCLVVVLINQLKKITAIPNKYVKPNGM